MRTSLIRRPLHKDPIFANPGKYGVVFYPGEFICARCGCDSPHWRPLASFVSPPGGLAAEPAHPACAHCYLSWAAESFAAHAEALAAATQPPDSDD